MPNVKKAGKGGVITQSVKEVVVRAELSSRPCAATPSPVFPRRVLGKFI